jgi:methylenetetrahydrofolate dehydrogenase (NADP+) / methenyltetrahydrofolate cyclohydrolase
MSAQILDGRAIAKRMRADIKQQAAQFEARHGFPPGLGVVLVGDDPASHMYVRMKRRACERAGIYSIAHEMPSNSSEAEVKAKVEALNADQRIHGILVQVPLPDHVDEETILSTVSLDKDVDGFHPVNIGALAMKGRQPRFTPATPTGCMVLLQETGVDLSGKHAVVLGRSNIVGMPMALMLTKANATVTICHSRTQDIPGKIKQADILIAALGKPEYVQAAWLKPGAIVIDVGTNQVDDPSDERGYRWVGDVAYDAAKEVASWLNFVPGGVGPMTITMLLSNTLKAARQIVGDQN